jgi:hypothetical protein
VPKKNKRIIGPQEYYFERCGVRDLRKTGSLPVFFAGIAYKAAGEQDKRTTGEPGFFTNFCLKRGQ